MNSLTIALGVGWIVTFILLIRSLFRQAGIQDAMKETTDTASSQLKLWEELGQHLDEGIALVDEKNEIVYANGIFADLTGWQARSSFHLPLDTIVHLQDADAGTATLPATDTAEPLYLIGREGKRTAVHAIRRPLAKPSGYGLVVLSDASSELAEKELRHRLVNLSSFELRAPVTAMKGYASMLLEGDTGKLSKETTEYVKPILDSTNNLLTIIDDMAQVEELSSKRFVSKQKPTAVAEFVAKLQPRLEEVAKTAGRGLAFPESSFDGRVKMDPDQVTRLLIMLTNTAARTAKAGSQIELTIAESPRTVDLKIRNQGSPLPRESQANVFDYAGGHGLDEGIGFYVAKQIIEAHHAYVTVNTLPDGNSFILSLPKLDTPQPAAPAPDISAEDREELAGVAKETAETDSAKPKQPPKGG
jgi:signal transduction histidine kinase